MQFYHDSLEQLKQNGAYRQLRTIRSEGRFAIFEDKQYLNFSSNDYLGLSSNSAMQEEFVESLHNQKSFLFGSTSSRLLTGNFTQMEELEVLLAQMYGRESALVFNSGYHANIGILPALTAKGDLILADKYVHASIIDGLRLCDAKFERYTHNSLEHLELLLKKNRPHFKRIFIFTESVFSMDGDYADLQKLCDLKEQYNAFLYVDEAHAFGVNGSKGLGLCEEQNCIQRIDFIVGTFGKAIASHGAYVVCNSIFRHYLINTMRPLIFSTAIAPVNIMWTKNVLSRLNSFKEERNRLAEMSATFRNRLATAGFMTKGCSQIVPLICGENDKTIALSNRLKEAGYWALPVRYPTVPKGEARIRFSFRPDITDTEIENLLTLLGDANS